MQDSPILAHPLKLLSPSSGHTFRSCPRKFELSRIGKYTLTTEQRESAATGYGSAFGAGLATLMSGKGINQAILQAIINYRFNEIYPTAYKEEKSLFYCINALKRFNETEMTGITDEWEILLINGEPATEVNFAIRLPYGFYYRGFIDLVMQHKETKLILAIEVKTDGAYPSLNPEVTEAKYKNAEQGTAYSLVADYLADQLGVSNDIAICYIVHYTKNNTFKPMIFPKPPATRVRFLEDLMANVDMQNYLVERNKPYPLTGNCSQFSRVCDYYGICHVDKFDFPTMDYISIGEGFTRIIELDYLVNLQHQRLSQVFNEIGN